MQQLQLLMVVEEEEEAERRRVFLLEGCEAFERDRGSKHHDRQRTAAVERVRTLRLLHGSLDAAEAVQPCLESAAA